MTTPRVSMHDRLRLNPKTTPPPEPPRNGSGGGDLPPYLSAALASAAGRVTVATEGTRNHTLNSEVYSLTRYVLAGELTEEAVAEALLPAAVACGLAHAEAVATIRSGLAGGKRKQTPKTVPERPLPPPPAPTPGGAVPAADAEQDDLYALRVQAHYIDLKAREEAKARLTAEVAARDFREPVNRPTLREELALPDEEVTYHVEQLLPTGGNALLTAQYKTGKTTTVGDYVRAYCDGEAFLGRFTVTPGPGRVAVFNYEVGEGQYRRWLRDLGIRNTDRAVVLNLRGFRLPVTSGPVEDWVVAWLQRHEVSAWVVDPFARAFTGSGDENSNAEVGRFLDTLDVIKARAGVGELILATHTGRGEQEQGQERARGATRLDDWADVRWLLTRDDHDDRYFRATGRDVEVAEERLTYDPETRRLTMAGGDRAWQRVRRLEDAVVTFVEGHPGCSGADLEQGLKANKNEIGKARWAAKDAGRIRVEKGAHGAWRHYPAGVYTLSEEGS